MAEGVFLGTEVGLERHRDVQPMLLAALMDEAHAECYASCRRLYLHCLFHHPNSPVR